MTGAPAPLAAIAEGIAAQGWSVAPGFLSRAAVRSLAARARARHAAGQFHAAAVGTGRQRQVRTGIRGDQVHWLDDDPDAAEQAVLLRLEGLRSAVNRELLLGLFELECHYALYPPGAFYARHVDQFAGDARRTLTFVLYLNEAWQAGDGGELRLYLDAGPRDVLPTGGTLVTFLSERFWHEVLPARRERLSLTGWFRRRA